MRTGAESALEYVVIKMLADKENVVRALYDYFVLDESPSAVAARYGLTKHQVRGYAQRMVEKLGSVVKAKVILKYAVPAVLRLKPIARKTNGFMARCAVCGEELPLQIMEDHIKKRHNSIVEEHLTAIINIIKKGAPSPA